MHTDMLNYHVSLSCTFRSAFSPEGITIHAGGNNPGPVVNSLPREGSKPKLQT